MENSCANIHFKAIIKLAQICLLGLLTLPSYVCQAQDTGTPVLLELFTSEGCSSCPPADQLLTEIDREQPIKNVDLIVIGEHVDYWNHGGWVDPYSSALFSARQQHYANFSHVDDVYTPQLVVDGTSQVVGSNWSKARAAIDAASHSRKVAISLQSTNTGSKSSFTARIGQDPLITGTEDVYLVVAADGTSSQVKGGENSSRHLSHTAVADSITKIGKISPQSAFEKTFEVPAHSKWGGPVRVIVFVQDPKTGRILGASRAKL